MRKKSDAAAAACDVYTRIHFSLLLVRRGGRGSFPSAPRKKRCVIRMLRILSKVVQVSYSSYSCFLSLSRSREKEFKKKNRKIERRVTRETGRILASNGSGSGVGCFFELNGGALGSVVERIEFQGGRFAPPAENGTKWQKFVSRAR